MHGCHRLERTERRLVGVAAPGFFGGDGESSFEGETQIFKIHLRNLYQKVGMFGFAAVQGGGAANSAIRCAASLPHDGSSTRLSVPLGQVFTAAKRTRAASSPARGRSMRRNMEAFMLAYDSNLAADRRPADHPQRRDRRRRGRAHRSTPATRRRRRMRRRRQSADRSVPRGWCTAAAARFSAIAAATYRLDVDLRALAATSGQEVTYTCTPPGTGSGSAIDQDDDGFADAESAMRQRSRRRASIPSGVPMSATRACRSRSTREAPRPERRFSLSAEVTLGSYAQRRSRRRCRRRRCRSSPATIAGALIVPKGPRFAITRERHERIRTITVRAKRTPVGVFKVTCAPPRWTAGLANDRSGRCHLNVGGKCFRGPATRVH